MRMLNRTIEKITPLDTALLSAVQQKMDNKTKPPGSLGRLEDLAIQMSLIQQNLQPHIDRKALFVFAADHGVAAEGVSAYPAEVTGQMVLNFLSGGAAINVLCRHGDIGLKIVDMGVKADFDDHPDLIKKKVRNGTRNFVTQPAMTTDETRIAIEAGMRVFLEESQRQLIDIVGVGEMGIANSSSATAIICAITGSAPDRVTGRGTGIDDTTLNRKAGIIQKALDLHQLEKADGLEILSKVGGFEIAGMVGMVLAAAAGKCAVVLDGLISTAAGLVAYHLCPHIGGYLMSGHRSIEIAQGNALAHMHLEPIVDLSMRLGEGTGAALAMGTVEAACRVMREMASFEEAGVSNKS
jgi:nicotinate-nucleotide--dimethylbenzimidazole phosphoribosyltransferase